MPEKPSPSAAEDAAPDLQPVIPPPSSQVVMVHTAPPRPRPAAAPPVEADSAEPVEAPLIAPQLSAEESSASQQYTTESLQIAEGNLHRTLGRSLTPTQSDLADKIRDFVRQAREAARQGDWVRARNLAHKAQLLSEELVRSP